MSFPASWARIPVTATYLLRDDSGTPATGRVEFRSAQIVVADGSIIVPVRVTATLDSAGHISLELPATDDPDIQPNSWTWSVTEVIDRQPRRTYSLSVPHTASSIDLSSISPIPPGSPVYDYLLTSAIGVTVAGQGDLDLLDGRVTALEGAGGGVQLSDATPESLGTASAGVSTEASRSDHVHAMPTAGDVGAAAAAHQHPSTNISDSTAVGRSVLTAADAAAARTVLGVAVAATIGFATKADMDADLAHDAGTLALVTNDPAPANNGTYRKTGASGSGAWVQSADRVSGLESRTASVEAKTATLDPAEAISAVWAVADESGHAALAVMADGTVRAPGMNLSEQKVGDAQFLDEASIEFEFAVADAEGNIAFGVRMDGSTYPDHSHDADWKTLAIGTDDSIVHIGDSYTASHYVLKDKAYISQLSAMSPFRHQNFGVSGNDALDMQYRIVNGTAYFDGKTFADYKARYAFITTHTNDGQFRTADLSYFRENLNRLIETVQAAGCEPVLTTEFSASLTDYMQMRGVADRYGIGFIDCSSYDREVAGLDVGPFHQGHPGVRTGGVFWLPMLDYIDRLPHPEQAIKVFRRRSGFAVSTIADLLYKGRSDRNTKWKELTLTHYRLSDATALHYDELNGPDVYTHVLESDEYRRLQTGQAVAFGDYALIEVTLPGTAVSLAAIELTLLGADGAQVYVRDYLDPAAAPLGKAQGSTPIHTDYLAKWDKPRGAWREVGVYDSAIVVNKSHLSRSMVGDKLIVMIYKVGGFNLTGLQVRYQGGGKRDSREPEYLTTDAAELLAQPLCGNAGQLAGWSLTGAPVTLVPIDQSNAPRKPGTTNPVDGVCVIDAANMIGQSVNLPAGGPARKRFKVAVWARYFPKAFLDPTLYPGLDAAQVIDRIANPASAPITPDTADLRTVKLEIWEGAAYPAAGGAEFTDFAPLFWRPVEFLLELPTPMAAATQFSFRLSCPDGAVQIAKVNVREVQP